MADSPFAVTIDTTNQCAWTQDNWATQFAGAVELHGTFTVPTPPARDVPPGGFKVRITTTFNQEDGSEPGFIFESHGYIQDIPWTQAGTFNWTTVYWITRGNPPDPNFPEGNWQMKAMLYAPHNTIPQVAEGTAPVTIYYD